MNGRWLVLAWLLQSGLLSLERYNERLDHWFASSPEDDFLLQLEWCSRDIGETVRVISDHAEKAVPDPAAVCRWLLPEMAAIYRDAELHDFAANAYNLWNILPEPMRYEEPFLAMCSAGDSLTWGDEERARDQFEQMFRFVCP